MKFQQILFLFEFFFKQINIKLSTRNFSNSERKTRNLSNFKPFKPFKLFKFRTRNLSNFSPNHLNHLREMFVLKGMYFIGYHICCVGR